jgi:FkbM family methyltransferase
MIEPYVTEGVAEYVLTLFKGFRGVCVDIGAYEPYWMNNSWIFERIGWDTYCIEPNPNCIENLKRERKNVLHYACSDVNQDKATLFIYKNGIVGEAGGTGLSNNPLRISYTDKWKADEFSEVATVKVRTLNWLMENEIKKEHIDYLSIDVENNEMNVLRGTDLAKWKPKIIVIENINEDQEQIDYLVERGYRRVNRIVFNDIYVFDDYYMENLYVDGMS